MILEEISLKLQAGRAKDVKALVQQAIDDTLAHKIFKAYIKL